jgi:hypothetical protein
MSSAIEAIEAMQATYEDEVAAHQETLALLGAKTAEVEKANATVAAIGDLLQHGTMAVHSDPPFRIVEVAFSDYDKAQKFAEALLAALSSPTPDGDDKNG